MKTLSQKTLTLDAGIYSAEAVKLAAFVFSSRAEIKIRSGKGILEARISAENAEHAAKEFLNEALNQQCRLDLAGKNSRIAGIITTKALLSAAGNHHARHRILE